MGGYQLAIPIDDQMICVSVGHPSACDQVRIAIGALEPEEFYQDLHEVTMSIEEFTHWVRRITEFVQWTTGQAEYVIATTAVINQR